MQAIKNYTGICESLVLNYLGAANNVFVWKAPIPT